MKQVWVLSLIALTLLCTGCTSQYAEHVYGCDKLRQKLFLNNLPTDEDGNPVYPDSYAGDYWNQGWYFAVTDIDKASEYQYLKDAYPEIIFIEEKYSYNYLQSLLDEYEASGGMLPGEELSIDCWNNRAVVWVNKDRLSEKLEKHFDENIPLYFEDLGSIIIPL